MYMHTWIQIKLHCGFFQELFLCSFRLFFILTSIIIYTNWPKWHWFSQKRLYITSNYCGLLFPPVNHIQLSILSLSFSSMVSFLMLLVLIVLKLVLWIRSRTTTDLMQSLSWNQGRMLTLWLDQWTSQARVQFFDREYDCGGCCGLFPWRFLYI